VNDPLFVPTLHDLPCDEERFINGNGTAALRSASVGPSTQLHNERGRTGGTSLLGTAAGATAALHRMQDGTSKIQIKSYAEGRELSQSSWEV